jgi:propionate CoA-transferase
LGPADFPLLQGECLRFILQDHLPGGKNIIDVIEDRIRILEDGSITKFVQDVYKISFSSYQASKYGQEIMYVTERAVFKLSGTELVLVEIAPGVDIDKDILEKMEFKPQMDKEIKEMDKRLFSRSAMKIKRDLEIF